jgi:hypothetical protein
MPAKSAKRIISRSGAGEPRSEPSNHITGLRHAANAPYFGMLTQNP